MSRPAARPLTFSATPKPAAVSLLESLRAVHPVLWALCAANALWLAVPSPTPSRVTAEISDASDASDSEDDRWAALQSGRDGKRSAPDEKWFLGHALRPLGWENPSRSASKANSVASNDHLINENEDHILGLKGTGNRPIDPPTEAATLRLVSLAENPIQIRGPDLLFVSLEGKRKRRKICGDCLAWDAEGRAVRVLWLDRALFSSTAKGSQASLSLSSLSVPTTPLVRSSTQSSLGLGTPLNGSRAPTPISASPPSLRRGKKPRDWTLVLRRFVSDLIAAASAEGKKLPAADAVMDRISGTLNGVSSFALNNPNLSLSRLEGSFRNALDQIIQYFISTFGPDALHTERDSSPRDPHNLIELFAQSEFYDVAFWHASRAAQDSDGVISETREKLQGLDLRSLGLLSGLDLETRLARNLRRASNTFSRLGSLRTPQEKLVCITRTIRHLMHGTEGDSALTTDHLLPLLLLVLINPESQVPNLAANARYLEFAVWNGGEEGGAGIASGELEFARATWGAVLSLLEGDKEKSEIGEDGSGDEEVPHRGGGGGSPKSTRSFWMGVSPIHDWIGKAGRLRELRRLVAGESPSDVLDFLESFPALRHSKDRDGNGLLHLAVLSGREEMVRTLLALNFDPGLPNYQGRTPLHLSVFSKSIFQTILDAMKELPPGLMVSQLDARDEDGNTALHLSAPQSALLGILCELSVDINAQNDLGATALHLATDVAPLIARSDLDVNIQDAQGLTALVVHARSENLESTSSLLRDPRTDLSVRDAGGRSIGHLAAFWAGQGREGWLTLLERLLANGADPNLQTIRGNTLLHVAADFGNLDVLETILRTGRADPTLRNSTGRTAAELGSDVGRHLLQAYLACAWNPAVAFPDLDPTADERALRIVAIDSSGSAEPCFVLIFGRHGSYHGSTRTKRTLDDFNLLRGCLLLMNPQALFPSLADLYSQILASTRTHPDISYAPEPASPTIPTPASQPILSLAASRKMLRRLNKFLYRLYSSEAWRSDELLWEFAMDVPLHWNMIRERVQSKRDSDIERIVEEFDGDYGVEEMRRTEVWIWDVERGLGNFQSGLRGLAAASRRALGLQADFGDVVSQFKFLACRPDGVVFPWPVSLLLSDVFDSLGSPSGPAEDPPLHELLSDTLHELTDLPTLLRNHDDALRRLLLTRDKLSETTSRLPPREELKTGFMERFRTVMVGQGTKVTEREKKKNPPATQAEVDVLTERAHAQAAFVAHLDRAMRESWQSVMGGHRKELGEMLDALVTAEIKTAKNIVRSLDEALQALRGVVNAAVVDMDDIDRQILADGSEFVVGGSFASQNGPLPLNLDPTISPTNSLLWALESAAALSLDIPIEPDRNNLISTNPESEEKSRLARFLLGDVDAPPRLIVQDPAPESEALTPAVAAALRAHLPSRLHYCPWTLLYSLSIHGTSPTTFFGLVELRGPTLWILRTDRGLLGAFSAVSIEKQNEAGRGFYGSGESFLFDCSDLEDGLPLRICKATLRNDYFLSTTSSSVLFGAGGLEKESLVGLYLEEGFERGYSDGGCPTFDMRGRGLGGTEGEEVVELRVQEMELWGVN